MGWWIYAVVVLIVSWVAGLHLGKFRAAYTEMTGMMVGMTMGMLNGFLLGYAAAGATNSMFWGNLFGILLGLALGVYYGRAGGLMGMLDGAMGGVMGGSMGAMLNVMLFPPQYALWTALLLSALYVAGMVALIVLIERSDLQHAALHSTFPWITRAIANEIAEHDDSSRAHHRTADTDSSRKSGLGDRERFKVAVDTEAVSAASAIPVKGATTSGVAPASTTAAVRPAATGGTQVAGRQQAGQARQHQGKAVASSKPQQGARTRSQPNQPQRQRQQINKATSKNDGGAPISWIGVLALMVAAVFLMAWWLTNSSNAATPTATRPTWEPQMGHVEAPAGVDRTQLDAQAVSAQVGADGIQALDFQVNGDNMAYNPNVIKVKKDVPARFQVSVEGRDPG